MKRNLLLLSCMLLLAGCTKVDIADSSPEITITIEGEDGTTVMQVDESSKMISKSVFTTADKMEVISKTYSYDYGNNLKSVVVDSSIEGSYEILYGDLSNNVSKSVLDGSEEIPGRIQKISRNYITAKKAVTDSAEAETVEYYYGADGKIEAIIRVDDKDNVIIKGAD